MTIIELSQNLCEVKALKPSCEAIYQDMQTCAPAIELDQRKLLEDEGTASGRETSTDSDTSESEGDDEGHAFQEDNYYAFLREMAGSFEATSEDESDEGSGDEVEDEVVQPSCRRRSSSFWIGDQHDGHSSPLASSDRKGCDKGIGLKGDRKEDQCKDQELEAQKIDVSSHEHHKSELSEEGGSRKEAMRSGSDSTGCSTSWGSIRSPSEGNLSELTDSEDGRDMDLHCPLVPTPLHDTRGPVEDDYDVIQALQEFAASRQGDAVSQQREDLLSTLNLKHTQASQLLISIRNQYTQPKLREHYQHVREQLLEEALRIKGSLEMLG